MKGGENEQNNILHRKGQRGETSQRDCQGYEKGRDDFTAWQGKDRGDGKRGKYRQSNEQGYFLPTLSRKRGRNDKGENPDIPRTPEEAENPKTIRVLTSLLVKW